MTDAELEDVVRCAIQGTVDGGGLENLTARDLARVAIGTIREHESSELAAEQQAHRALRSWADGAKVELDALESNLAAALADRDRLLRIEEAAKCWYRTEVCRLDAVERLAHASEGFGPLSAHLRATKADKAVAEGALFAALATPQAPTEGAL